LAPKTRKDGVSPIARLAVITGVRVSGENILQDPLGWLIPEVPFSRGHLAIIDPFLARPATRWGAILGSLLTSLADALRELDDLATLWRLLGCIGHEPLLPLCGRGCLLRSPRPPVAAATTGAVDGSLSRPRFFFFFLLS
jgi:hypothetical protein